MSGILFNVLDGASTVYKESIPLSSDEKGKGKVVYRSVSARRALLKIFSLQYR